MTSHLESLKQGAVERKNQLAQILDLMRSQNKGACVFAGDTNLREAEVPGSQIRKTVTTPPSSAKNGEVESAEDVAPARKRRRKERDVNSGKFLDAWLAAGGIMEQKFTWDMQMNDNLPFAAAFKPRARYDRAFLLGGDKVEVKVDRFELVGKERLSCGKFISDHWGLWFEVVLTDRHV